MAAITHVHDCDVERRATPTALNGDFRDTYLEEVNPDTNYDGDSISCGVSDAGGGKGGPARKEHHGILRYDLYAFLPADAVITSAVIHFYVHTTGATSNHIFTAVRLATTDWLENEATWNDAKVGSAWPTAGGDATTPSVGLGTITTIGWKSYTITNIVTDAWNNRNGICNIIIYRSDAMEDAGRMKFRAKNFQPTGPSFPHHLRVAYTLADRTYQVTLR